MFPKKGSLVPVEEADLIRVAEVVGDADSAFVAGGRMEADGRREIGAGDARNAFGYASGQVVFVKLVSRARVTSHFSRRPNLWRRECLRTVHPRVVRNL